MIKLNILRKIKTTLFCVAMVSSGVIFAQSEKTAEKSESTIVMTKAELDSFLTKIADARRAELKRRDSKNVKQELAELRLQHQYQNQSQQRYQMQSSSYENASNEQVLRELRYINQRIDNQIANNNGYARGRGDNSTIIMPGNTATVPSQPAPVNVVSTNNNNKKIAALEATIDSLKRATSKKDSFVGNTEASKDTYRPDNSSADSVAMMKGRLSDVRRQMQLLELKMKGSSKETVKEVKGAEKTYFKQQVYFANNSETLGDEYIKYVQELTQILIQFPEAKVLLEGWASPKGTVLYNKQLSMRRAESVEKAFLNNGISASRVLSSFRGVDRKSSEQHARRVDMSIIVR